MKVAMLVLLLGLAAYAAESRIFHVYPMTPASVAIKCDKGTPHVVTGGPKATMVVVECQ